MPRANWNHNCTACTPLEQFGRYDLYHCMQGGRIPTVIARYGHDGPDYTSGMHSAHPALAEAQRRAVALGLATEIAS